MAWDRETLYSAEDVAESYAAAPYSGTSRANSSFTNSPPAKASFKDSSPSSKNYFDSAAAGDTYRLMFWGQCAHGRQRGDVMHAFANRFKIANRRQLEQLFSGKVMTLKKGLSYRQADKYSDAIEEVGAVCRKESEQKNYFSGSEFKVRNTVSFLDEDFDPSALSLTPKDEFSSDD